MAATVSILTGPEVPGNRKFVTATVTFDSSYATGGEAISLVSLGLNRLDFLRLNPQDSLRGSLRHNLLFNHHHSPPCSHTIVHLSNR
jgi:hypothetical protein